LTAPDPGPEGPLGRFLEVGIATQDIRASVEFYERLGFAQAQTGDTWPHPYGVLTDGRIYIGLHRSRVESPALTFVRPDVAGHAVALERLGVSLSTVNVGAEVFNELAFRDPAGQAIRLLEARTYSPADSSELRTSHCGDFDAVSLPAADIERSLRFWQALGLVTAEEDAQPYPRLVLRREDLHLALHRPRFFAEPLLVFRDADMAARIDALRELGADALQPPPPGLDPRSNALLTAPEGTTLLLLQDAG
jgi:catechol 2,3-dioxygenase-like lactoylglutathione lyase family enzyme